MYVIALQRKVRNKFILKLSLSPVKLGVLETRIYIIAKCKIFPRWDGFVTNGHSLALFYNPVTCVFP